MEEKCSLVTHLRHSCEALKKAMETDGIDELGDSVDELCNGDCIVASESFDVLPSSTSSNCDPATKSENSACARQIKTSSSGGSRCTNVGPYLSVQQNSARAEQVVDLVEIKSTAQRLGNDIVLYMSLKGEGKIPKSCNRHSETLRRTVDNLSERHEIPFVSMTKKLQIGEPGTNCQSIVAIADEMFSDKQCNWGRVVTLYAFAGWLAKYCAENKIGGTWIEDIGRTVGQYVADHLSDWIAQQPGGWNDMDRFFPAEENVESKVWRGLVYTMLGLGALATTIAAVR